MLKVIIDNTFCWIQRIQNIFLPVTDLEFFVRLGGKNLKIHGQETKPLSDSEVQVLETDHN